MSQFNAPVRLEYWVMVRLETFLNEWKNARMLAAEAVEEMPPGKLDYRPGDDLMSFRDVAVHIADAGRAFTGLLVDGVTEFTGPMFREKAAAYARPLPANASNAALAAALRSSIEEHCGELAGATPEFLAGMIARWDGAELTRFEMLLWLREHELAHRMQLFLYLRLNGVVPPTTRRRLEQQKNRD